MAITTVKNELIAVNAVSGTIIADNAVTAVHIAQNAVTATQIPAGSITTAQLAADAVSGAKLADSSIVTANIQDDQITGDKLTDNITIAGTLTSTSTFSALGASVFNENSADVDFRIEGNSDANLFFIDAGNDRVGIGTSTPQDHFHLAKTGFWFGSNSDYLRLVQTNTNVFSWYGPGFGYAQQWNANTGETTINGALVANGGVIFNEASADKDFRVESNNNANMLFVDGGNDRVGIGTAAPNATLSVVSESGAKAFTIFGRASDDTSQISFYENDGTTELSYMQSWSSKFSLYTLTSIPMLFGTGGSERMRIDSAGKVGIGMTPGHKFDIKSAGAGTWPLRIFNSQDSGMSVGFYESSSGDGYNSMLYMQDGAGNLDVKLSTNGPSWFNGGNVGIGTSSPDYLLEVEGAFATNVPGLTVNNTSNTSWQQGIHVFHPNISAATSSKEVAGISVGTEWDSYNAGKLGFYYAGDNSTSNLLTLGLHGRDKVLTVSAAAKVGIGKGTTPAVYTLDVDGDINFTGTLREDGSAFVGGSTTLAGLTTATVSSSDPAVDTNPSAVGHLWINSTSGEVYICTDATSGSNLWTNIGDGTGHITTASGGNSITTVTISSQAYRVHVFTSTGNFVCGALDDIDILMVAGGGSGGVRHGGGGGAGGMIEITDTTFSSGTYVCTVGAGGARATSNGAGTDGVDSTIVCAANSVSITATGGGGGAGLAATTGRDGGSGGGAGPYHNNAASGLGDATQTSPSMTGLTGGSGAGFGYDGGGNPGNHAAGGGGGAGGLGGNSINESGGEDSDTGGVGGVGRQNNIDGNNYYYAGGGGGGGRRAYHGGAGSHGGGGANAEYLHSGTSGVGGTGARNAGANADEDVAGSAGANTGSGGGGISQAGVEGYPTSSSQESISGAGGSGIIIIRYEV